MYGVDRRDRDDDFMFLPPTVWVPRLLEKLREEALMSSSVVL